MRIVSSTLHNASFYSHSFLQRFWFNWYRVEVLLFKDYPHPIGYVWSIMGQTGWRHFTKLMFKDNDFDIKVLFYLFFWTQDLNRFMLQLHQESLLQMDTNTPCELQQPANCVLKRGKVGFIGRVIWMFLF